MTSESLPRLDWLNRRKLRFFEGFAALYRGTGDAARSLRFLAEELGGSPVGAAAARAADSIERGGTLTASIGDAIPALSAVEAGLLEAGERSGDVSAAVNRIIERLHAARNDLLGLVGRLTYPLVVLHMAGFVGGFVRLMGKAPVWPWLLGYFGVLYGAFALLWWIHRRSRQDGAMLTRLSRIPVIGAIYRDGARARVAEVIAILYQAGVPLDEATRIASRTIEPMTAAIDLRAAADRIKGGHPLSSVFPAALLDPVLRDAIRVGEESGELASELQRAGTYYRERERRSRNAFVRIASGALYAVAMVTVAYLVISFYAGLFSRM